MVEKKSSKHKKSVKEFQNEIRAKEGEMQEYAKKQETAVRHLCGEVKTLKNSWKGYGKDLKKAAIQMRNQGINRMREKVRGFNNEISNQKKENEVAISKTKESVNNLKNNWKAHGKSLKKAAIQMRNQGINRMREKVRGFNNEISNQKKENRVAVSRMKGDVGLFVSEIDGKRKDFQSYARGPFQSYIKAFWG